MHIKLIKKNNEGFTPDAIKRFTVDDPNYVDHIIIPDKKNGDDVIVKIVRGTKEHPLFSGTMYYGRALRSSATEPFSTGMGSLKLMADFLDKLAEQDPEESLADLDAIEQRAKSEKREGATGSVEIKEGPQEGDLIYTPAAQSVAEKLGDDLLMAILAAASDEAWSQADEYEWKDAVDTDHDLEWNTCKALGWGFDDMDGQGRFDEPFKDDSGKVYSGDEAKNAYNAIAALEDDDRYSLFFNNQPRNYSHIRDVVATAMDMAASAEDEELSDTLHKVLTRGIKASEEISPKLQDRLKFKEFEPFFNKLPFFGQTVGEPLDSVRKEGLGYGVGDGSKKEQEEAAKDILRDFDDYVSWTAAKDTDGSWYIKMTFKPELWALPIEELKKVFGLLDDAFGPWS